MPWCFPEIPSFQFACQSKRNALDKRQRHLASEYCLKVSSDVTNPAHSQRFNKRFSKLFHKQPNQIRPLGFPVSSDLSEIGFLQKTVLLDSDPPGPPCFYTLPSVDFPLHALSKSVTSLEMSKSKFLEFCENPHDHLHKCTMYTHKINDKVAAAARDIISSLALRATKQAGIFMAELVVLNL